MTLSSGAPAHASMRGAQKLEDSAPHAQNLGLREQQEVLRESPVSQIPLFTKPPCVFAGQHGSESTTAANETQSSVIHFFEVEVLRLPHLSVRQYCMKRRLGRQPLQLHAV